LRRKKNRVNKTRQDLWFKNVGDKIGPLKIKHFYFSDFKKVFTNKGGLTMVSHMIVY
jgi:hypothetical protein